SGTCVRQCGEDHPPTTSSPKLAERTGLEPAASGVTGRRYNQLNYRSVAFKEHPGRCKAANKYPRGRGLSNGFFEGLRGFRGSGVGGDRPWWVWASGGLEKQLCVVQLACVSARSSLC